VSLNPCLGRNRWLIDMPATANSEERALIASAALTLSVVVPFSFKIRPSNKIDRDWYAMNGNGPKSNQVSPNLIGNDMKA